MKLEELIHLQSLVQVRPSFSNLNPLGQTHEVFAEFDVNWGAGTQRCEQCPFNGLQ